MRITITNVTNTTFQLNFLEVDAGATNFEVQYAVRADFKLCLAPIHLIGIPANTLISGLWPGGTYYIRAREKVGGVWRAWAPVQSTRTGVGGNVMSYAPQAQTHAKAMLVVPMPIISWAADHQEAGYPVDNLGYDAPVGWRSAPGGAMHAFTMQMAPEPINVFALLMGNVSSAAKVTLKAGASADAAKNNPAFTHGPVNYNYSTNLGARPGYHCLIELAETKAYPFWRVEIDSAQFQNRLELHYAVAGLNRATKMHAIDRAITPLDLGSMNRGRDGAPQRALGWRMRREEFEIAAMNEGDFEKHYRDLGWRVGNTEPVLIVPNPKRVDYLPDRILYGTLGNSSRATNLRGPLFTRSFSIDSLI